MLEPKVFPRVLEIHKANRSCDTWGPRGRLRLQSGHNNLWLVCPVLYTGLHRSCAEEHSVAPACSGLMSGIFQKTKGVSVVHIIHTRTE